MTLSYSEQSVTMVLQENDIIAIYYWKIRIRSLKLKFNRQQGNTVFLGGKQYQIYKRSISS